MSVLRRVALAVVCLAGSLVRADDAEPRNVQRFAMNPFHANVGRVARVEKSGLVDLVEVSNPRFSLGKLANLPDLSEGLYLGFVGAEFTISTEDTRLVRVRVASVGEGGTARVEVSPRAAERIEKGESLILFRPPGASTKQVEACPDYVAVDDGRETSVLGRNSVNTAARLARSRNNMKQLGLAVHNFHDTYGALPPAVVRGPDGKPWHSWRVLVLPFLEERELFERYRWDEPWDGPNNEKLLAEMPEVFADPIHDGPNPGFLTHYAAVTGPRSAFTATGVTLKEKVNRFPDVRGPGTLRFRDFTDGTSNTILFGSVGPKHEIPWMKPEDVVFEDEFPVPGEKGSFAAPYESRRGRGGVFCWCDGSVRTIRSDVDAGTWQYLVQRNDGRPVEDPPGLESSPSRRRGTRAMQFVEVYRDGDDVKARLAAE